MKKYIFGILLMSWAFLPAQTPSAQTILEKADRNMASDNRVLTSKMVIHGQRAKRTIKSKTWSVGNKKSFTEFLFPAREKGVKMLKIENKLWIYSPSTDRIIQISGHLLRQSMMGSDLSYEDMMDDETLTKQYGATVAGSDTVNSRPCWLLELTAKTKKVSYYKRKIWVDKKRYVLLKEELFAKSGTLLKRLQLTDVVRIDGRWYPKRLVFKDMLKTGEGTEFIIDKIKFNVVIPAVRFSKASLRR